MMKNILLKTLLFISFFNAMNNEKMLKEIREKLEIKLSQMYPQEKEGILTKNK